MREILFRGKIEKGKWIEGDLYQSRLKSTFMISYYTEYGNRMTEVVTPETIGQYTGLTDKNGKKIFEGDIVEYQIHFKDGSKKPFRAEVKAEQTSFGAYHCVYGFCAYLEYGKLEESEVIGNIHDNPELLKGE